jgi:histidinol phosphatase-like PHP family hydrolase
MSLTSDWHIHSQNSYDRASMPLRQLITEVTAAGVRSFGVTDHVNTQLHLADLAASRAEFDACGPAPGFHFGVEVSVMAQAELDEVAAGKHESAPKGVPSARRPGCPLAIALTEAHIAEHRIEYVVGGVHWAMDPTETRDAAIRDHHRQNMFLVPHPLIDVFAHPWQWGGYGRDTGGAYTAEPWFDDFGRVPGSMHDEFAAAAVDNDTKVEINIAGMLLNAAYPDGFKRQYLDYLAGLKERGVALALGSDCHEPHYDVDLETTERMLDSVNIHDADLWTLPSRGAG